MRVWEKTFRRHKAFIFVLLIIIVLHGHNLFHRHVPLGDEGSFLRAAAKINDGDLIYIGANYRPLHNAVLAASFFVFGNYDWAGFLPSFIFGISSLVLVYLLAFHLFGSRKTAVYAVLFTGLTQYFAYYSKSARTESMFLAFFLAAILIYLYSIKEFSWKKWSALTVVSCLMLWLRATGIFAIVIITIHELYIFIKNRKDRNRILARSAVLVSSVLIFYLMTYATYKAFSPDPHGDSMATSIDSYNSNSVYRAFDILANPANGANFMYYLIVMWHWCIPGMIIASLIGLFMIIRSRNSNALILLWWVLFFYLFLSVFPAHRVKIFYPIVPPLALSASFFISKIKSRTAEIAAVTFILVSAIVALSPTLGYTASAPYTAAYTVISQETGDEWFSRNRVITSDWVTYWWYLQHYEGFEDHMNIKNKDIVRLEDISEVSELADYYTSGYRIIILSNSECAFLKIADKLLDVKPIASFPNDVTAVDPLILNDFQQQPFLAESDIKRHIAGTCETNSTHFRNILIYRIKDVINHYKI